jgi:putative endonuclease
MTASVYILFSPSLHVFYTGFTTISVVDRLRRHNEKYYDNKFTSRASDWEIFLTIECDNQDQARAIEAHIKKMKSKIYIRNLKKYPNMTQELLNRFAAK